MDALAALIGALVGTLVMGIAAFLEVAVFLLISVVDFLFLLVFQGRDKANARYAERREKRAGRKAEKASGDSVESDSSIGWIRIALTFSIIVAVAGAFYLFNYIGKQRIKQTNLTVDSVAQQVVAQIENNNEQFETGLQDARDAWGRPVELLVDNFVFGKLIVVRSFGPNGRKGGGDDIFAADFVRIKIGKIAGKIVDMGADAIKDKARKLLDRNDAESK